MFPLKRNCKEVTSFGSWSHHIGRNIKYNLTETTDREQSFKLHVNHNTPRPCARMIGCPLVLTYYAPPVNCSDWLAVWQNENFGARTLYSLTTQSLKTSTEYRSVQNALGSQSIFVVSTSDMHSQKTPRSGLSCKMVLQAVGKVLLR